MTRNFKSEAICSNALFVSTWGVLGYSKNKQLLCCILGIECVHSLTHLESCEDTSKKNSFARLSYKAV